MNNEFYGYSLFHDIEDKALQSRNRAVVMANMMDQYNKAGKVSPKGVALVTGYFAQVPEQDRKQVHSALSTQLKERGYVAKLPH